MSKDSYAQYLIRQRQRKRLEKERQRRLEEERRRQEEIQKERAQLRRREEIRSEKERLAVVNNLRALSSSLQQREKNISNDIPEHGYSRYIANKMREIMGAIDVGLQAFHGTPGLVFAPQLEEIKHRIAEIKQGGYDPFYYQSLKWLERDLNKLIAGAPQIMQNLYAQAEEAKGEIDELLVRLQVVNTRAILDSHRQRADSLIATLEGLALENNPQKLVEELPRLVSCVQRLWADFAQVEERDQTRSFVLQNVREVLEEMGYQALDLGATGENAAPAKGQGSLELIFRTPEQGAIQVVCGLDNSLQAEFISLKSAADTCPRGKESALDSLYQCEKWCQDYDHLQSELARRDIMLKEHWRIAPTDEDYRQVIVPEEFIGQDQSTLPAPVSLKRREQ